MHWRVGRFSFLITFFLIIFLIYRSSASFLSVRAGSSYRGHGGEVVAVYRIIQHPRYNSRTIDYDISLLHLSRTLQLGWPIRLVAQGQNIAAGTTVAISGWGALSEGGSSPSQLQAVTIPIVSVQACKKAYGQTAITDRMICAGVSAGGRDSCQVSVLINLNLFV